MAQWPRIRCDAGLSGLRAGHAFADPRPHTAARHTDQGAAYPNEGADGNAHLGADSYAN